MKALASNNSFANSPNADSGHDSACSDDPMTYCCAMLLDEGLVMASDTRTNAGVDRVSTFRKMFLFEKPGERVMALVTAGNLSITQSMVSLLEERWPRARTGQHLYNAPNMFEAARTVGDATARRLRARRRASAPPRRQRWCRGPVRRPDRRRAAASSASTRPATSSRRARRPPTSDRREQVRQADPGPVIGPEKASSAPAFAP